MNINFDTVDSLVERGVKDGAYPSACLCIGIGDTVCLNRCYGEGKPEMLFDMASMSKILSTTMIAFNFIESGRLRLYDKVSLFFNVPEDKKDINIFHLMTHTSGMYSHFYLSEYSTDPALAVQAVLAYPLENAVGAIPVYSCMGYILLGKILEQIGGAPLDVLAQELVFNPLKMYSTGYRPIGCIAPTELDPATGKLLCGVVHDENARFLSGISGNAGVFSNIGDMQIFAQMLACKGKKSDGSTFISPAMLRKALVNYTPGGNFENRGLGFNLAGSEGCFLGDLMSPSAFGHTGFTGTSLAVDPETGLYVVLLTNRVCPTRENITLVRMRSLIHNAAAALL